MCDWVQRRRDLEFETIWKIWGEYRFEIEISQTRDWNFCFVSSCGVRKRKLKKIKREWKMQRFLTARRDPWQNACKSATFPPFWISNSCLNGCQEYLQFARGKPLACVIYFPSSALAFCQKHPLALPLTFLPGVLAPVIDPWQNATFLVVKHAYWKHYNKGIWWRWAS